MGSKDEIKKLARLSRLEISEIETESYGKELDAILNYIKRLEQVDTSGVEAMSHVHGIMNVFREDAIAPADGETTRLSHSAALSNAPQKLDSYFVVPITVDSGDES